MLGGLEAADLSRSARLRFSRSLRVSGSNSWPARALLTECPSQSIERRAKSETLAQSAEIFTGSNCAGVDIVNP